MSKFSPYRMPPNTRPDQNTLSPSHFKNRPDKSKQQKEKQTDFTNKRYANKQIESSPHQQLTQKRRKDASNIDIRDLIDKNKQLAQQNQELYYMLEERGKIIVALQKKLQEQIMREMKTLQAIEYEKKKFISQSHQKFKEYQRNLAQLMRQNDVLNRQNRQINIMGKEQLVSMRSIAKNESNCRDISNLQLKRTIGIIENKNYEMIQMNESYKAHSDKLKNQIVMLNNQIIHMNHVRKMEVSQQKIMYEGLIDALKSEFAKEREIVSLQHDLQIKNLQNLLALKTIQANKIDDEKNIQEVKQNIRQQQLLKHQNKLESQIEEVFEFHKKNNFDEIRKLKELNQGQMEAIEKGNDAVIKNLRTENEKIVTLLQTKSTEIQKLYKEISDLRQNHNNQKSKYQANIAELKNKIRDMYDEFAIEQENLKVKYAQLRQADIRGLKQFYQHEVQILTQHNIEKSQENDKNRQLLHNQIEEKIKMRRQFDLEALKRQARISELQLRINEQLLLKKQAVEQSSQQVKMTSMKLIRETTQKQRMTNTNEEQKKYLQQMIIAKDKQIQDLNKKLTMVKENNKIQIEQKNDEIQILKRNKNDLDTQLKKQRYFFDNEIKKKDFTIKNNKQIYESQAQRLKSLHRQEYDSKVSELTKQKNKLQIQLNQYKQAELNLKSQIISKEKFKSQQIFEKQKQLKQSKQKLTEDKQNVEEKLHIYYQTQISKLQKQIDEYRRQLQFKQEDLRKADEKYHRLSQKLQMNMQSQQKLTNLQNRIINLGQENNIVKNWSELMKSRKKDKNLSTDNSS